MPTNYSQFVQVFPGPPVWVYMYERVKRDDEIQCEHCERSARWVGRPLSDQTSTIETWPGYCQNHMDDEWRGRRPADQPMTEGQYAFLAPFPTFD